jgi:predicted transcriptional regulator
MCLYRQRVIANRLARQQALCNRRKKQGGTCSQRVAQRRSVSTVQTRVQCNDNSTRSYENQSVVFRTQNCIKACQNCFKHCLTVKLLKSKVTLFNTCEKLKKTQRDTGKSQRSMRLVIVKHVTIRLKCGSGWSESTERICG